MKDFLRQLYKGNRRTYSDSSTRILSRNQWSFSFDSEALRISSYFRRDNEKIDSTIYWRWPLYSGNLSICFYWFVVVKPKKTDDTKLGNLKEYLVKVTELFFVNFHALWPISKWIVLPSEFCSGLNAKEANARRFFESWVPVKHEFDPNIRTEAQYPKYRLGIQALHLSKTCSSASRWSRYSAFVT